MNDNKDKLSDLQNVLFHGKGKKEKNQIFNLCEVMQICGGYKELLDMPIPALVGMLEYLEEINKKSSKGMQKGKLR